MTVNCPFSGMYYMHVHIYEDDPFSDDYMFSSKDWGWLATGYRTIRGYGKIKNTEPGNEEIYAKVVYRVKSNTPQRTLISPILSVRY